MGDLKSMATGQNVQAIVDGESQVVISKEHHETHAGTFYSLFFKAAGILTTATQFLHLVTPAATAGLVHLKTSEAASSGTKLTLELFEGGTVAANGTAVAGVNRNRNSSASAGMLAYHTPTTPAPTTLIDTIYAPASAGPQTNKGMITDSEFILKPATKYFVKLTNGDGGTQDLSVYLQWYEEL